MTYTAEQIKQIAKNNFDVKVVQASEYSGTGKQIWTFELCYPRFIHSELMTHRQFSRNAASSRAVPVTGNIEYIRKNTALPVNWGKNQPGMTAKEEIEGISEAYDIWCEAREDAITHALRLHNLGCHKQIVNRLLEPFTLIRTVVTATEWENWFWLRDHADAQPEIAYLAKLMRYLMDSTKPFVLHDTNEWHVPYIDRVRVDDKLHYFSDSENISITDALKVSVSCCAQVSYRKLDTSVEKAKNIWQRLVEAEPVHASPMEHQAFPLDFSAVHSGNFRGWYQYRQSIPNNVKR